MTTRRLLLLTAAFALANLFVATDQSFAQARLNDLSSRLATQANEFADASYRPYAANFRDNRAVIQGAMLAHHFNGGARLFSRMVTDRVRRNELRDAFQVLQSLASPIDSNNSQPARWANIQSLMSDISRLLNNEGPGNDDNPPPSGSGRMTWRGRVDDDVRIVIRGGTAQVETLGGTPYYDAATNFSASLPSRRINVRLAKLRGRGEVSIEQQPSRQNDFAAVIRIRDPRGGATEYEFEVSW